MEKNYVKEINKEIEEILCDNPGLINKGRAFTFWYIRGFLWPMTVFGVYDNEEIKSCIFDQPKELYVDAIYKDKDLRNIFILQTKFR